MAKISLGTLTANGSTTQILAKEIDAFEKPIMFFTTGSFDTPGPGQEALLEWSDFGFLTFKPFIDINGADIKISGIGMVYVPRIPSDIFVRMTISGIVGGSPSISGFLS